jgi:hypothetical protein
MTLESHASGWRDLGTVGWSVVQLEQPFPSSFGTREFGVWVWVEAETPRSMANWLRKASTSGAASVPVKCFHGNR